MSTSLISPINTVETNAATLRRLSSPTKRNSGGVTASARTQRRARAAEAKRAAKKNK